MSTDCSPQQELVRRLGQLDSAAVSDACDQLGLANQVVAGLGPVTGWFNVAGRVITVELGPWSGQASGRHLCAEATDSATPGHVIVVAHQGRTDCAGWGGNLSRAALARGAAGTIVDGAVRDVDESLAIGYRVFAAAATPRTARGRAEEKSWGGTIVIGGVSVDHGDYVVTDSAGAVFIPVDRVDEVLAAAELIAAKEAMMAAALADGQPVSAVMGVDYDTMLGHHGRSPELG